MAITGIMLLGFVFAHMIGNLKLFLGESHLNAYAEWLRDFGEPAFPRSFLLWCLRVGLIVAFVVHIVAAAQLTRMNHKARPDKYQSPRDYAAANFASRTMRWTGVIVGLFLIFHLLDLTWGTANPDFHRGDVYDNVIASFERWPVAVVYIVGQHRARHPHLPRSLEHVPEPRLEQPALQLVAPRVRGRVRGGDHHRQREHAAPRRDGGGELDGQRRPRRHDPRG